MSDFFVIINVFKITLALRCSQLLLYLPSLSHEDSVSFHCQACMIKGSPLNGMGKLPRCCCHIGWAIAQKCNMNNKERRKKKRNQNSENARLSSFRKFGVFLKKGGGRRAAVD